jgi:cell division protein FtsQ
VESRGKVDSKKRSTLFSAIEIGKMEETITVHQGRFLRSRTREEKGGEKFQRWLRRLLRIAAQLLVLFFFLFLGHAVYIHLMEGPLFRLREIEVKGNRKIPQETLLSLALIEGMPNLFTIRLKEVTKKLESHPWIDQVRGRKVFPNKIVIEVVERKPIAILQLEELFYIDTQGEIFSRVGERDGYNYPILTGLTRGVFEKEPEKAKLLLTRALELLMVVEREKVLLLRRFPRSTWRRPSGSRVSIRPRGWK